MNEFQNKIALITGAASGIGKATAEALAEAGGAGFVLVDLDETGLERLELQRASALLAVHDCADAEAWAQTQDVILERFGGVDFAVINAGVAQTAPIADLSFAAWREVLRVNLDGAFLSLQAAMRLVRDGGSIVVVASAAAVKAEPGQAAYAASKAGAAQLARVAAKEAAARGVRVNALLPGGVDTPIWDQAPAFQELTRAQGGDRTAALAQMARAGTPLARFATAQEAAGQILFLLSDASAPATGAWLTVDGGYSL